VSLRLRVALFMALVVAAATVAVSWAAYTSAQHEARSEVDQALLGRVGFTGQPPGGSAGLPVVGEQEPPPEPWPSIGISARPDVIIQVIDASGAVAGPITGEVTLPVEEIDLAVAAGADEPVLRDVWIDGVHYRMLTNPATGLHGAAAVQVARDVTETDALLSGLRMRLFLIGGSAVLVAGVVAWFVSRGAVRPVARLTEAAEHVAATRELEVPIEVDRRDEIGRLAESFNTMLGALASSRAQQRRLVADAGHELRTPLTSLRTNIDLLSRANGLSTADRAEVLADARHELEELSALVAELLDLAADAPPEALVELSLDEAVGEVVERFRRRTGRKVTLEAAPTPAVGKPIGLARAVSNLLDNAHKWSLPEGKIEVRVQGGRVEVRDHGPGIYPADLPRVFERFFRSAAARGTPGSGLGLAIVQQTAEEHGGRAFATNAPGGGALVGFEIPVVGGR
jgi:two-component system sensor histidine kinase MprB